MLFLDRIHQHVQQTPDAAALSQKVNGTWQHLSWRESWQTAQQIAQGLSALGLQPGDKAIIMANNCVEWSLADLACMMHGVVSVPIYPTASDDQFRYILEHSEAKLVFAEHALVAHLTDLLSTVENAPTLINLSRRNDANSRPLSLAQWLIEPASEFTVHPAKPDDLLTIVYTSGTTGQPKGVMISHGNLLAAVQAHEASIPFYKGERSLAALPLSHIFERGWTYIVLYAGGHNFYLDDINNLAATLPDVKPNVFCAVPRIFEKIHTGIFQKAEHGSAVSKAILHWAARLTQSGQTPGFWLTLQKKLARQLVGKKIKKALGGEVRFMPCGGAALDADIHGFFMELGINVKIGYGMTETLATVSFMPDQNYRLGTLGKPMTGIEIKIAPETNEILVKSPGMTPGYYKNPEATAELIQDGWLHTGDAGHFDADGNLVFEERLKELMKTSGGKYIAPQHVEGVLAREPLFEQVAVIADARNYASALIVPAWEGLEEIAHSLQVTFQHRKDLLQNQTVLNFIDEKLRNIQSGLARYEQVKRFTLLETPFTLEGGEITPTMKLKRRVINDRYAQEITRMYS